MGLENCCGKKNEMDPVEKKYKEMDLPLSNQNNFKNKFEKDFFMTINILRGEPKTFKTYIKNFMASGNCKCHPIAAKVL